MLKLYFYLYYLLHTLDVLSRFWFNIVTVITFAYLIIHKSFPKYNIYMKISFVLALLGVIFIPDKNTLAYLFFSGGL